MRTDWVLFPIDFYKKYNIMKKLFLLITFIFIVIVSFSQIVSLKNDKVTVRDKMGNFITSGYYSNLKDVDCGTNIVVFWYKNNKVEVRDYKLRFKTSRYFNKLKNIKVSDNNIILYYENGKTEIRDKDLDFISSQFINFTPNNIFLIYIITYIINDSCLI